MKSTINIIEQKNNSEDEIRRVLFCLSEIKRNFFLEYGFLLDIENNFKCKGVSVKLTKEIASYVKSEFDWAKFDEQEYFDNWIKTDITRYKESFTPLINYKIKTNPELVNKFKSNITNLYNFVSNLKKIPTTEIIIGFSKIGTISYFNTSSYKDKIYIILREDADFGELIYCFLSATLKIHSDKMPWEDAQKIMGYLFDTPLIKELTGDHNIVYKNLKSTEPKPKTVKQSDENYRYIGFPKKDLFLIKNNDIYLDNYGKIDFLSESEYKLLKLLIDKKGEVTSFDDISLLLWNDEFFSLQAISKIVERIRKKFYLENIHRNPILTVRGKGYVYMG
jgi:hypothetical protein